jgi:hypothetical protein
LVSVFLDWHHDADAENFTDADAENFTDADAYYTHFVKQ